ncbi:MAG: hypothetical protein FJW96_14435, partial [Actinobacteria bacterium]|nr:hypothetical protein [Actinomycetota bacterium]
MDAVTAVLVPDIGDVTDVLVVEIHVAPGDTVKLDDPIVTLESDKASMDVPSTAEGVVTSVGVAVGDVVSEGKLLIEVESAAAEADGGPSPATPQDETPAAPETAPPAEVVAPPAPIVAEAEAARDVHASPLA